MTRAQIAIIADLAYSSAIYLWRDAAKSRITYYNYHGSDIISYNAHYSQIRLCILQLDIGPPIIRYFLSPRRGLYYCRTRPIRYVNGSFWFTIS